MGRSTKKHQKKLPKIEVKSPINTRSKSKTIHGVKPIEIQVTAPISTRITRSKVVKTQEKIYQALTVELKRVNIDKLNTAPIPTRVTRSTVVKSQEKIQQVPTVELKRVIIDKPKTAPIPVRITRSKVEKPKEKFHQQAPVVETTKRIVKRAHFVQTKSFKASDIVLAKQKYSTPWPSKILDVRKGNVLVHFYGDKRQGLVESTEIYDYVKSLGALKQTLSAKNVRLALITGVCEVEDLMRIPRALSIINTI